MNKYFYHVTDEAHAEMILKNGLIPHIGTRSSLVGETEKQIYLSDRKSLPFWATILDMDVVLRVSVEPDDVKETVDYELYQESLIENPISAANICRSKIQISLTVEQHKELALSYIDTISDICLYFARYITYFDTDIEYAEQNLRYVKYQINILKFVLPHISFYELSAKELRNHLHDKADEGYTLCDVYEVYNNKLPPRTEVRLYELLNVHPLSTEETHWLFWWLKRTFPRKFRIYTGGWTG